MGVICIESNEQFQRDLGKNNFNSTLSMLVDNGNIRNGNRFWIILHNSPLIVKIF